MLTHLVQFTLIFTLLAQSRAQAWTTYQNKIDHTLSSFCAVGDNDGNIHMSGGLSGYSYLGSSYHIHVARGSPPVVSKARHKVQLSTIFLGWFMDVVGFSCEGSNMAYHGGTVFYVGINDHSNLPKCFSCDEDDKCDDITTSQCTQNFGTCLVQDGSVAYVVGGSRGVTVTTEVKRFDLATKQMTTSSEFGPLARGVHHAGCALVGNKLVVVGGGYADKNFAPRWQVCDRNGPCREYNNLPASFQVRNPGVVPNLNGNTNCEVLAMGGEAHSGAVSEAYILNACTGTFRAGTALPTQLQGFSTVVTGGLLCVLGGLDASWTQSRDISCRNFGNTPEPTRLATLSPTRRPTLKPTQPPSRRPTDRPTERPTGRPTTATPTSSPTARPTHADDSKPIFNPDWKVVAHFTRGLSSSACAMDSETGDLIMAGGRQYESNGGQIQHNGALYWPTTNQLGTYQSLLAKRTFPEYGENFQEILQGMYTPHESAVRYKGKMYVCSPQYWNPRNVAEFLKCERKSNELHCFNVCTSRLTTCPTLSFSPCCVGIGRYLYWVGGSLGSTNYQNIVKYDMETDTFETDSSDFGPLVRGVHAASCAVWNDRIYVFGGNSDVSARGTSHIQICPRNDPCRMSAAVLPESQTYGHALTIGSSMVVGCATGSTYDPATPALYDAYTDKMKDFNPGPALAGRTECCLAYVGGNLTALGGFQDDSVVSNPVAKQDRLRNCLNILIKGTGTNAYDGSYRQVVVRSLQTSENVWRSYKNWIFYSDAAQAFWIWSSEAYCFNTELKSGAWTSYAQRGRRSTVDLTFTCNDEFMQDTPTPTDPCANWSWSCERIRVTVIVLVSLFALLCLAGAGWYFCRLRNEMKLQLKQKSVSRVQSTSRGNSGHYSTITAGNLFPDADGLEMESTQNGTTSDEDSRVVDEDDRGIQYDMEDRPGDVDESAYYYQQNKFTQDVLFPTEPRA